MTSEFVSVLGVRVHYNLAVPTNENRSEESGTVLLIHGFLSSTFTWQKCLQPLADQTGYRVLAYDRLGFGFTERILDGERYTRKQEEVLALELLSQLNISRNVHLVSNSSGAVIAFDMALSRSDLIQSIIYIAPYGLASVSHAAGPISRYLIGTKPVQALMKFGLTHFLPFKNAYYNTDLAKDETIREGYLKPIRDDPLFLQGLALFTQHHDQSASEIKWTEVDRKQKVLIIVGEQDKIVSKENTQEFYRMLKQYQHTEYVNITHCGHLPQEERPDELIEIICQFLKS
ncbi:unnamed protein product [Adineta ricciae]|uniref:AB hydrolase-1 domain-containing protein n=1 Tax=Adineta ricciae TaxID=249248 RepID=A0A813WMB0_ADIRI|nr:unnamed protein product [Adineta ricciae]